MEEVFVTQGERAVFEKLGGISLFCGVRSKHPSPYVVSEAFLFLLGWQVGIQFLLVQKFLDLLLIKCYI